MKNAKRLLALVLALVLCLSVFAGCEQKPAETSKPAETTKPAETNKPEETTAPAETTAPTEAVPLKNVDIYPLDSDKVYKVALGATEDADEAWSSQLWEKITGVEIEYIEWTNEQLQTALATKELPDAIYYTGIDKALLNEYGEAGVFVDYSKYLDYMPNFVKALEDYPDAINFVKAESGSFYTLPRIGTTSGTHGVIYIRTDMMNAAGWNELPATTEDFIKCMEDIQAHYGATDPEFHVFSAYQASYLSWNSIANVISVLFPSFGDLIRTGWDVIDGEVTFGATSDQYKRLMQYMNRIFNLADGKGFFMGKDIYSADAGNASKASASANHQAVSAHFSYLAPSNFASGDIVKDLTVIAPLTSEWQSEKHFAAKSNYVWLGNCINAKLPEEDIITLVRWFDSFYAQEEDPLNEEGTLWGISYFVGEYGVDWEILENGNYTIFDHEGYDTPSNWQLAINPTGGCLGLFDFINPQEAKSGFASKCIGSFNNTLPYSSYWFDVSMMTLNEEEQETYSDYWTEIDKYIAGKTAKYITGELDVEADWENYLKDLESYHLQDVIDAYQSAYDRFSAA